MHRISAPLSALLALIATGAPVRTALAQGDEPVFRQLQETFKKPYLSLGVLLQTVADFQVERTQAGTNGFSMANFRLMVSGELDNGFGYLLQTAFTRSPAILDARLNYRATPNVRLSVGQFKAPFSRELLTSAAGIDFVNRAQAIAALSPARQIGGQVDAGTPNRSFGLTAGAFNGNGIGVGGNDDNHLLYVARAAGVIARGGDPAAARRLALGASAAFSKDRSVTIPGVGTGFRGDRTLLGADARLTYDRLLLSGEVIGGRLEALAGAVLKPWGYHATAGYMLTPKTQALVRLDSFDPKVAARRDLLVFGFNAWPTRATELQFNYLVDTDDTVFDHHQLLVNFQIGF